MDLFPKFTGAAGPPPSAPPIAATKGLVMAYFDGNTLGTCWSLAQQYALNDNSFSTNFGPSTPGAINLISGQTNGFDLGHVSKPPAMMAATHVVADGAGDFSLIGDTDPFGDALLDRRRSEPVRGQEHRRPPQREATSPGAGSTAAST